MKKMILAGAVAALLTACASVGGLVGGGDNPQVKQLAAQSTALTADFAVSLAESAESYVLAMKAVCNETEASRIAEATNGLRNETDKEKLEAAVGTLNEVNLDAQLQAAQEVSDEGKAQITESILHLGMAIYLDAKIGADAGNLVSSATDVASNLSAKDALAINEVQTIITNAQWISGIAPDQLTLQKNSFEALKNYAEAHGIEVPSQEVIEEKAKGLAKE